MSISLINLSKDFFTEDRVVTPVKDIDLEINDGEFLLVIGRSGSGKTTLLNLMAGLLIPSRGKVLINGADPGEMDDKKLSSFRAKTIGYVFQYFSLIPSLTAIENVMLPATFINQSGNTVLERGRELLNSVGIGKKERSYPRQLSSGEQKRVVIARSLMNHPEILLADEPTADLDVSTEQEIMSLFKVIHSGGVTVVMVTHSLELMPFATWVLDMDNASSIK